MKNLLVIGNLNVMNYVSMLKTYLKVHTYKSLTYKCNKYELSTLDKYIIKDMDVIIVLNEVVNINALLEDNKSTKYIFTKSSKQIIDKKIKIINTTKIPIILKVLNLIKINNINKKPLLKPFNNCFDSFSNICLENLNKFRSLKLPAIPKISDKQTVFIEFRYIKHSETIIRNTIYQLNSSWCHTIVTGTDNYLYYLNLAKSIHPNISVININMLNPTHNDYNNLLLNVDFWKLLSAEKILIYQSDSFIFKNNIDDFLEWDYIGSPFPNNFILADHQVGNGGLSLRSKSKMIEILNKVDIKTNVYSEIVNNYKKSKQLTNYPEDIIFSQNIQTMKIGKVADFETAKHFSIDFIYNENSMGMHCMWNGTKNWENELKSKLKTILLNTQTNSSTALITNIQTDQKLKFINFCNDYLDYIKMLDLPIIKKNQVNESVLIEFRCLTHLEFLLRNTIYKLGNEWSHTIVCGNINYNYINNIVKKINRKIKIIKLDYDNLSQTQYNDLLLTTDFWKCFSGDKLLIYQEDTCLFKSNINDFLEWDYIGAPWPLNYNISKTGVGNGGFSLRSRLKMIECLKYNETDFILSDIVKNYMNQNNLSRVPEDVFFSNIIHKYSIGKLADFESGKKFSSEGIVSDSLGGHQFWMNNPSWKNIMFKNVVKTFEHKSDLKIEHRGGWSIILNKLKETNVINPESEIIFYDVIEEHFLWNKTNSNKKWFGVIHCTEYTPPYLNIVNIRYLFEPNSHFLNNLHNCLFLIALSPNVVDYVKYKLNELNVKLDVYLLKHPIDSEKNIPMFSIDKYINNPNKRFIQIGQQLRKMTSIYKINLTDHSNIWFTGTKDFNKIKYLFKKECNFLKLDLDINNVEMLYTKTFEEYDEYLSKNIVFVDLFDAAANNVVLECILRNTPIVVNRLPATIYYLGENYPLFFDDINEIPKLLTIQNVIKAHNYLKKIKTTDSTNFISSIINILNAKVINNI